LYGLRPVGAEGLTEVGAYQKPVLYEVGGLPVGDRCVIGYAGKREGKRKWRYSYWRNWYANPERMPQPDKLYDSPEDARYAAVEAASAASRANGMKK
jgi:hypothetical protein